MSERFDAVTLEILWKRLVSAVDEASAALIRVAFSTVVRESYDFACVVTDTEGRLLAQATQSIPSFIGTLPRTVRHFIDTVGLEAMRPGDVYVCNDPWRGTGHLSDINVARPVFRDGTLVGFAASTAHAPDIGGRTGSLEMRDIFEEGFQIPALRLMRDGVVDQTLLALLRANVRAPDEAVGDLYAQMSALDIIEQRLMGLMDEYGLGELASLAAEIHGRSEAAMRAAIAGVPPGTYRATMRPEGLATEVAFTIALTFGPEGLDVAFEAVTPQVDGMSLNSVYAYTFAYTCYGLKCILAPELPNNDGLWRPVRLTAPEGSILNHRYPTAGYRRHMLGHHLPVAVIAALSEALPDRIIAATGGAPTWTIQQTGIDAEGKPYANFLFFAGGIGAGSRHDGPSVLSWPSNISGVAVEYVEHLSPFRVHRKALREGSGGAGMHRGGLGLDVELEVAETTPIHFAVSADRLRTGAAGAQGGAPGAPGEFLLNGAPADPRVMYRLKTGDRVVLRTPGGGGFGLPASRSTALAEHDAAEKYNG